jgi:hypothetical protein
MSLTHTLTCQQCTVSAAIYVDGREILHYVSERLPMPNFLSIEDRSFVSIHVTVWIHFIERILCLYTVQCTLVQMVLRYFCNIYFTFTKLYFARH